MPPSKPNSILRVLVVCLLAGAGAVGAEEPDPPPAVVTTETVLEYDRNVEPRLFGLSRARVSYPQQLSAAIGVMRAKLPADWSCATECELRGLLLQVEPGIGGGQISFGWGQLVGEKKRNDFFLADVYVGYGLRGALLRTWGNSTLNPTDQTFAGIEGVFTVTRASFSLGAMRRISSGPSEKDWLVTAGIGWGF